MVTTKSALDAGTRLSDYLSTNLLASAYAVEVMRERPQARDSDSSAPTAPQHLASCICTRWPAARAHHVCAKKNAIAPFQRPIDKPKK